MEVRKWGRLPPPWPYGVDPAEFERYRKRLMARLEAIISEYDSPLDVQHVYVERLRGLEDGTWIRMRGQVSLTPGQYAMRRVPNPPITVSIDPGTPCGFATICTYEEEPMSQKETEIIQQIDYLEQSYRSRKARLQNELERVRRIGDDCCYEVGTTFRFSKRFRSCGEVYLYAAIKKADDVWYLTGSGRRPNTFNWSDLMEFLSSGIEGDVQIASGWRSI